MNSPMNAAQAAPVAAYPEYEALTWVPGRATPQEAAPIYRPQPQYGWWQRTLSPQPLQQPSYRPAKAPRVKADTPLRPGAGGLIGPIGARNSELDMGGVQPSAPRIIVPGSNAALVAYPRAGLR